MRRLNTAIAIAAFGPFALFLRSVRTHIFPALPRADDQRTKTL